MDHEDGRSLYFACISFTIRNRECRLTNLINSILSIKCADIRHTCNGDVVTGYNISRRGHSTVLSSALRSTVAYDRTYETRTCAENNVISEYISTSGFLEQTNLDLLLVRECVANASK